MAVEDKCATHIDFESSPDKCATHIDLDNIRSVKRSFMDHGGLCGEYPHGRFPSSRDWSMPEVKCSRKTCVANYGGKCTMPSLIEICSKGCKGYHKRSMGEKK